MNKEKDWQWSERTLTIGRANDEDMSIWNTPLKDDILTLGLALAGWLAGWLGGRVDASRLASVSASLASLVVQESDARS